MKRILLVLIVLAVILVISSCTPKHTHEVTGELIVVKEATCAEEGVSHMFCTGCGEIVNTITISKTNDHTEIAIPAVESTCIEKGLSEGIKCVVCDKIIVAQQETPLKAHQYDDKYDETCNECGYVRDAECAHKETEVIKGKDPTCTEIGYTYGEICKKCGEILIEQDVIEAKGHNFGEWVTIEEPTLSEEGLRERYCECGEKETENTPKLEESKGLIFELNEDGVSYAVTGIGSCNDTVIVIPSTYNGLPVTAIGGSAFYRCTYITRVVMPNSVKRIEYFAFDSCTSLQSITLSNSLTSLCTDSFYGCTSLTSITIPASVTYLNANAYLYELTSIIFEGTTEQCNALLDNSPYAYGWWIASPVTEVVCLDGVVPLKKSYD